MIGGLDAFTKLSQGWPTLNSTLKLISLKSSSQKSIEISLADICNIVVSSIMLDSCFSLDHISLLRNAIYLFLSIFFLKWVNLSKARGNLYFRKHIVCLWTVNNRMISWPDLMCRIICRNQRTRWMHPYTIISQASWMGLKRKCWQNFNLMQWCSPCQMNIMYVSNLARLCWNKFLCLIWCKTSHYRVCVVPYLKL